MGRGGKCKTKTKTKPFVSPESFIILVSTVVSVLRSLCRGPHVWATSLVAAGMQHSMNRTHDIADHPVRELRLLHDLFISLPTCRTKSCFAANTSLTCRGCLLMSSQQTETSGAEPLAGPRLWLEFYGMV